MKKPATIMIEGRRYLWRDILALRKAQIEEAKRIQQPALFALPDYSCGDGGKDRCRCFLSAARQSGWQWSDNQDETISPGS